MKTTMTSERPDMTPKTSVRSSTVIAVKQMQIRNRKHIVKYFHSGTFSSDVHFCAIAMIESLPAKKMKGIAQRKIRRKKSRRTIVKKSSFTFILSKMFYSMLVSP